MMTMMTMEEKKKHNNNKRTRRGEVHHPRARPLPIATPWPRRPAAALLTMVLLVAALGRGGGCRLGGGRHGLPIWIHDASVCCIVEGKWHMVHHSSWHTDTEAAKNALARQMGPRGSPSNKLSGGMADDVPS